MDTLRAYLSAILVVLGLIAHSRCETKRLLLDNEPNVDLGGELNQLKAQLLEQQKLINAMEVKMKQQEDQFNGRLMTFQNGSGSVYVRWARTSCPPSASIVYTGYTAGKHYTTKGSGSDNLCLPSDPTWSNFKDGDSYLQASIYGTEIETTDSNHIFNYPVNHQDLPCVVCRTTKTSTVMIPARNNCYPGWTLEYSGYLMAAFHDHYALQHVCVDKEPEFISGGSGTDYENILYLVVGKCGSLPCPPYVDGRELACAVCSK